MEICKACPWSPVKLPGDVSGVVGQALALDPLHDPGKAEGGSIDVVGGRS